MRNKGFTLIELLAVVVVIALISLISVPIILNLIENSRRESFKVSVVSAYKEINTKLYQNDEDDLPENGLDVKELDIKSNFKSGKFVKDDKDYIIAYFITDGRYCAYGRIRKLAIANDCSDLDITPPIIDETKMITTKTTNKIEVNLLENVAIDLESGIKKYIVKIYKGDQELDSKEMNTIGKVEFKKLIANTEYRIELIVYNKKNLSSNKIRNITTSKLDAPTYEVSPTGWTKSKTVTITYPSGFNNEYSIDSGLTWKAYTNPIVFTANGTVIARVNDGNNYVTGSSQTVSQIDTVAPTIPTVKYNSGFSGAIWQNNINITLTSTDNYSGILRYEISWNGDGVVNKTSTSNFIPQNGWNSATTKFRAVDLAGNVSGWTGAYYIAMDTEAPKHTNWWWGTINSQIAQLYIRATDNIGMPNTATMYNNHRAGVYCPTATASGGNTNWYWFGAVWDSAANAYRCDITPSTFGHYNQTYLTHLYIYDYAGNGGYYNQTTALIPMSLATVARSGDYVKYVPQTSAYVSPASLNGYADQAFYPANYTGLWRVLYNDSTYGLQITSSAGIGWLTIQGLGGYNNILETLNGISGAYIDNRYAIGSRHIGTNPLNPTSPSNQEKATVNGVAVTSWDRVNYKTDMQAMLNATSQNGKNILAYEPSWGLSPTDARSEYLLTSRQKYTLENSRVALCIVDSRATTITSGDNVDRCPVTVNSNGSLSPSTLQVGVRPVIKLTGVVPVTGAGTKANPYVIKY